MERNGETVGLVADALEQFQGRRGAIDAETRFRLPREDDLFLLGQRDDRETVQPQFSKGRLRGLKLSFPPSTRMRSGKTRPSVRTRA